MKLARLLTLAAGLLVSTQLSAQGVTLPPSGDNQKASVSQHIGLVEVTIEYSSPDVTSPSGESRTGHIWGELVPYGLTNLGFGPGKPGPWRAGANENTVFTVSHDVLVQGKPLPAGRYGLHMIAEQGDWTIVFSNNSTSWGSFFYDPSEDALRVTAKPEKADFREWLTYDFIDRKPDRATVALWWENLRVPFTIEVPNTVDLYVQNLRNELRSAPGFSWQNIQAAAQYCLQNDTNLEEALQWAQTAVVAPFIGQENFSTLQTLGQVQAKLGKSAEAQATMAKALDHPAASPTEIHQYGRQLLAQGKKQEAMAVFEKNAQRFGDTWPTHVGLARGYSAMGKYDKALEHAKIALGQAPDPVNKQSLENAVKALAEGKDIN